MSDHGSLFYLSNFRGTLHYTLSDFNIDRRAKGVSYRYVEIDQCEWIPQCGVEGDDRKDLESHQN